MYPPPWAWQLHINEITCDINKFSDFITAKWNVSTFGENVLTQRTNISQTTNTWCYKIVNRQKIHSKCKLHHGLSGNKKWKFINMISDSTLQVEPTTTCQVLAKIALPFPTICLYDTGFSSYTSTKTTNIDADLNVEVRIQVSSNVKLGIKEICKNIKNANLISNFFSSSS